MNWEQALRRRLLDDATVSGIVGTGVDWRVRPQERGLPTIVLSLRDDARPQTMRGFQQLRASLVLAECLSGDEAEIVSLREAVIDAVVPAGTFSGVRFERSFAEHMESMSEAAKTSDGQRGEFVHTDYIYFKIWHEN